MYLRDMSSASQKRKRESNAPDGPSSEQSLPLAAAVPPPHADVLRFLSTASVVAELAEDTMASVVSTALSPLGYASGDTNRWLSAVAACPLKSDPNEYDLFRAFLGPWHPALATLSLADVVGAWCVCHFLGKEEPVLYTLEADILQRFATALPSLDQNGILTNDELRTRLTQRWEHWMTTSGSDAIVHLFGGKLGLDVERYTSNFAGLLLSNTFGGEFSGTSTSGNARSVAAGVSAPRCVDPLEVACAAGFGQLERIKEAEDAAVAAGVACFPDNIWTIILWGAAVGGHIAVLDYIANNTQPPNFLIANFKMARTLALRNRRRNAFMWFNEQHPLLREDDDATYYAAILARDPSFLTWLSKLDIVSSLATATHPATKRKLYPGRTAWEAAAATSQRSAIKLLAQLPPPPDDDEEEDFSRSFGIVAAVKSAAALENGDILQELRAHASANVLDQIIEQGVMTPLARRGCLSTLKLMRSINPPYEWGPGLVAAAADARRCDVIEWLRAGDDPCPWDVTAAEACVRNGDRALLQYLKDGGCDMPESTASIEHLAWQSYR